MAATYYPPVSFSFKVSFGGGVSAETSFKEVSGLQVNMEPEEIVEGGQNRFAHRLPQPPKYSNLVLKRGLATSSSLRDWVETSLKDFTFKPAQVTVQLLNEEGTGLMSWNVVGARPVKWQLSDFDSMAQQGIAIETLELAFDYFETV